MTARRDPFPNAYRRINAARVGMALFLVTLGVLFAAPIVGMVVVRLGRENPELWLQSTAPALPMGLALSTLILLTSSATFVAACRAIRRDDTQGLARWMLATLGLAALFLLVQAICWVLLLRESFVWTSSLYAFLFYVLTALHAAHVIGGLVPIAIVTRRAIRGWYDASNRSGIELAAMYWHFLDVVWIALLAALILLR